jgi:hypothetical protein
LKLFALILAEQAQHTGDSAEHNEATDSHQTVLKEVVHCSPDWIMEEAEDTGQG